MIKNRIQKLITGNIENITARNIFIFSALYILAILVEYYFVYTNGSLHHLPVTFFVLAFLLTLFCVYLAFQIFKKPEIGIPVIAFFLPFERIGSIYHYIPVNIRLSQVFVVITVFAILYNIIFRKYKFTFKKEYSSIFLVLFILVSIISLLHAPDKVRGIEVLVFDIFVFFTYFLITNLLNTKEILQKTIFIILAISSLLALYGIYQFIAGNTSIPLAFLGLRYGYSNHMFYSVPRVQGTALEPLYWGDYLLIPIALSFSIAVRGIIERGMKLTKLEKLAWITFVLCMLDIFFSFSRGAWYASTFVIFLVLVFNIVKLINLKTIVYLAETFAAIIVLCVLVIIVSHAPVNNNVLLGRATAIQDQSGRQINTPAAINIFKKNEVFGVGVGGFGVDESPTNTNTNVNTNTNSTTKIKQGANTPLLKNNLNYATVSNQYLEIISETGILGILTYVGFMAFVIINGLIAFRRVKDPYFKALMIGLLAAIGGILLQYISFSTIYIMHIWFLLALLNVTSYMINNKKWGTKEK